MHQPAFTTEVYIVPSVHKMPVCTACGGLRLVLTPVCITGVLSLDGLMQSEQIYTLRTMRPPRCRPNQHTHLERPRDGTEAALYLSLFSSALDKLFLYRRPPSKISGSHDTPRAQREDTVGQQARGAPKSQRRVCKCPFCEYNIFQKKSNDNNRPN